MNLFFHLVIYLFIQIYLNLFSPYYIRKNNVLTKTFHSSERVKNVIKNIKMIIVFKKKSEPCFYANDIFKVSLIIGVVFAFLSFNLIIVLSLYLRLSLF